MKVAPLKRQAVVLLATLGALTVALSMPPVASSCGESVVVRDYLEQIKRAAPIREVPTWEDPTLGQLPLPLNGLRLQTVGNDLIVENSELGFTLRNTLSRTLHRSKWIVESELVKVSARGRAIRSLGVKRRGIGIVQSGAEINLMHQVSETPAYYRADIRLFRKGTDSIFDRYSFYARVMKPRVDLRLRIDKFTVAPGEFAKANFLNLGTVSLLTSSYDYGFRAQVFTGEKWISVRPNPPRRVPKPLREWALAPGIENRGCLRYLVPSDQAPGAFFRFVVSGTVTEAERLTAEFLVVPSS